MTDETPLGPNGFDEDDTTASNDHDETITTNENDTDASPPAGKEELEDALEAKRNRDMSDRIGPTNPGHRTQHGVSVSGRMNPDQLGLRVAPDHDQIVATIDIGTVSIRYPIASDEAQRLQHSLERAIDEIGDESR